ncbi:hypothetical protein TNCV_790731 [Trichonephila clavipes]|nr:hypothetical protein TNCV_790731 [Trichonephila clavipes]
MVTHTCIAETQCRGIVSLKTRRAEELMYVKPKETQNPPVGVQWKFGDGVLEKLTSPSLELGLKLRGSLPVALLLSQTQFRYQFPFRLRTAFCNKPWPICFLFASV